MKKRCQLYISHFLKKVQPEDGCRWTNRNMYVRFFDVLLTVHLSIFISLFNQLDAQSLFHNKFYFMPLHVSSTCAHHQDVG